MKKIGRKKYKNYYFDFEKEEKWLNEMAKYGYVLDRIEKDYYIFEECNNGQYSYKIDILKDNMSDNEVEDYFSFLKELDINIVYSNKRWVYLRKETGKGEFDLYSDKQSLIDYYNRYNFLRYLFGVLFFTQVVTYDSFLTLCYYLK